MLELELKCPVFVDNDTNLAAQGEFHSGAARGEGDFVFITVGEGVGAGIFLNGSIYRGSQWSAGEIGYLRVPDISREHPSIHKYGKLETALSASGILRSWRATNRVPRRSRVTRVADVWDLAASGNAEENSDGDPLHKTPFNRRSSVSSPHNLAITSTNPAT